MPSDRETTASGRPDFVRTGFQARYQEILRANLPPHMQGFVAFFSRLSRLDTLASMLARHLPSGEGAVLNVGSGPFAAEIFVSALQGHRVVAIDYTSAFVPFYGLLRAEGVLPRTSFLRADALSVSFRPAAFDAVVIHDVLYETELDAGTLIHRFAPMIRPDGLLYLDFMNAGTERVWRWLGKERAYRRYRPSDVQRLLGEAGFQIVETRRHCGSDQPLVRLFHTLLWIFLRTCNTYAVVARKPVKDQRLT